MPASTPRARVAPACEELAQSIAGMVAAADVGALDSEIDRLVALNRAVHERDCINLNPAGNAMNPPAEAPLAEAAERQVMDRKICGPAVDRLDPAFERWIMRVLGHAGCLNSRSCRKAACFGARLVRDHSSSMSHLTASSLWTIASSSGSGQASSIRWPLGSKK